MKKLSIYIGLSLVIVLSFSGCRPGATDNTDELKEKDDRILVLEERVEKLEEELADVPFDSLPYRAGKTMKIIKNKDMNALSQYVHPEKGLRFTPYPYVDIEKDQVFTAQEVANLMENETVMNWGAYDGSGEPIDLKFSDYYDRFVYDKDFINPQVIGNNTAIGQGNTTDNVKEAYPDGYFIEFHFSYFEPQYGGIDWENLKLVFEKHEGTWFLVGIIHGEWTI